jgi:hypothetical protein
MCVPVCRACGRSALCRRRRLSAGPQGRQPRCVGARAWWSGVLLWAECRAGRRVADALGARWRSIRAPPSQHLFHYHELGPPVMRYRRTQALLRGSASVPRASCLGAADHGVQPLPRRRQPLVFHEMSLPQYPVRGPSFRQPGRACIANRVRRKVATGIISCGKSYVN